MPLSRSSQKTLRRILVTARAALVLSLVSCSANEFTTVGDSDDALHASEARTNDASEAGAEDETAQGGAGATPDNLTEGSGSTEPSEETEPQEEASPETCPTGTSPWRVEVHSNLESDTTNELQPFLRVTNEGSAPVDLTDLTVRYWFSSEALGTPHFVCHYAAASTGDEEWCGSSTISFRRDSDAEMIPEAADYVEVSWPSSKVLPGQTSFEVRWSYYETTSADGDSRHQLVQHNDYSATFDDKAMIADDAEFPYRETDYITVHDAGVLVAGTIPCRLEQTHAADDSTTSGN